MKSSLKEINGRYYMPAKAVMLPTEKATIVYKFEETNKLIFSNHPNQHELATPQHLYFISDEEIKEGNWFICNQSVQQCIEVVKGDYPYKIINRANGEEQYHSKHWKDKVIATTDKSLGLPESSKEFLEVYVKAYNEGNQIKEVLIEYEERMTDVIIGRVVNILKVKSDNTITIKKVKDSWNRKEVIELLNKLVYDIAGNSYILDVNLKIKEWWIEQNL